MLDLANLRYSLGCAYFFDSLLTVDIGLIPGLLDYRAEEGIKGSFLGHDASMGVKLRWYLYRELTHKSSSERMVVVRIPSYSN
jgi:hypothetical protein